MTFTEYTYTKCISNGSAIIEAQHTTDYESANRFRDAFKHITEEPLPKSGNDKILMASWIDTILGPMIAIADEQALYLLEFVDRRGLKQKVEQLRKKTKSVIILGHTKPINLMESELKKYFQGTLKIFKTPLFFLGSLFQKQVWEELQKIPLGETRSYSDIAVTIEHPSAFRAVAQANGANPLAIIVPCHRVINANGNIGGYSGGLNRKKWLLTHEKNIAMTAQFKQT